MHPSIEISGRKIGYEYDPLVIADIGINHGGSIDVAMKMVDLAVKAGVEIVKHQTHIVEDEMSAQAKSIIPVHTEESIYDIIDDCALTKEEEVKLKNYVESKGIIFVSTPFSRAAANRLEEMNVPAYKIGSGECNNYPLIEHIAGFGKPIILSTGMNSIASIRKAANILEKFGTPYALLHCTSIYPTPPHLVRLGAINQLIEIFPKAVVGLSDHTTSNHACFGAVALGASILERHFTDSMEREGPDIINSMDPKTCAKLIEGAKIIKQERGGEKEPVSEETPTMQFGTASIVTIKKIKKGDVFSHDNLWVKRPGTGPLYADDFVNVLGKYAEVDIDIDEHLKPKEIKGWNQK